MKTNFSILLGGLALFASASAAHAVGTTGALFLRQEPTARMFSMGGAGAAVYDDAGAAYLNPGGLGFMCDHRLTLSTWQGLDEQSRNNFVSGIANAGRYGVFGLSFLNYTSGKEDINDLGGNTTSVELESDYAAGLGWGHKVWGENLSVGGQIKQVHSKLAEAYSAKATTLDFGALAKTDDGKFSAGAGVQNAIGSLTYISEASPLPRVVYGGAAARFALDNLGKVLLAVDAQKPRDDSMELRAGGEYSVSIVAVRLGGKRVSGSNSITVGGGLRYKGLNFDYAFEPAGDLAEPMHRFTLSFAFGGSCAKAGETAAAPAAPAQVAVPESAPAPAAAPTPAPSKNSSPLAKPPTP